MLPAANRGAGMSLGFPDVCLTPAGPAVVPVPYPNIAMNAQATGFSTGVKVSGVNALNMMSRIPMTTGDEAGSAHATIKGGASYTMGNPIVFIDKAPAITLTSTGMGNNGNCPLNAVIVPSAVTVMFCRKANGAVAGAEGAACPDAAPLEALGDEMLERSVTAVRALGAGVLYLRLERIAPGAAGEVCAALEASASEPCALIVDLRGNPGGALDAAVELSRLFLPRGASVVRLVEPDGDATTVVADVDAGCALPVVLLVDGGTASAAELFAASLQDNQRALLVGTRTYGKRIVHRLVDPTRPTALAAVLEWDRPLPGPRRIVPDVPTTADAALDQAAALALTLAR